jgi:hypothetical protein
MDPSSYNLFGDDYYLWNVRAYDISGNYDQGMKLDPSSNFAFRRNGSTIATLGSNLITPSTSSLYNGLDVSGTYFSNSVSAIKIPADTSDNRPAGQAGYMRYNTNTNVIEYWNASVNLWLPISEPSPIVSGVSPTHFNVDVSNSFNLTGSNFSSAGVSIVAIGTNGSGTIFNPTVSTYVSQNSATVLFDASATQFLTDASNQLPFAVRLTNNNSGFSSLLQNSIISANVGPVVVQPNPQTIPFQTFPVQDPSANFKIVGQDPAPTHYPFQSITITSGTAGNINIVGAIDSSSAIVTVPSAGKSSATAGTYPFTVTIKDASGGVGITNLSLALADPIVTSVVPSTIQSASTLTAYDLSLNGNYFVNNTGVNYINQSTGVVVPTTTTYNSITQLKTNVTFPVNDTSSNIIYDVSLNNGTVYKLYTSVVTVLTRLVNFSSTQISGVGTAGPTISYETSSRVSTGGPVPGGYTVVSFVPTSTDYTQNYQWNISFSKSITLTEILVVGGGGAGSNDTNNTNGNGGGGAGGFRETNALAQTFTASTTYLVQCGRPGQQVPGGAQTTANGQTIINTTPTGPSPTQSSYASGISTGSTNIYVASGGGNGGFYTANPGGSGGSGGGASTNSSTGGAGNAGGYSTSEGTSGAGPSSSGGGGGGALSTGSVRNGGVGKASTYFASYSGGTIAGGGGGTGGGTYGVGGVGGTGSTTVAGGAGSARAAGVPSYLVGLWGTPGTGGGGGATDSFPSSPGGSGRVQFRFLSFIP